MMKLCEQLPEAKSEHASKLFPDFSKEEGKSEHPLVAKAKEKTARQKLQQDAKEHFSVAIELDPTYVKPLYQRMCIFKAETEYEEALTDAVKIKELEPGFAGIGPTIAELEKLKAEKFEKMKDEVIGGLKNLGNMFLSNFGMSIDNFKMQQNSDGTYNL
jgi:tetratricopeptide (TPR) repeat protein